MVLMTKVCYKNSFDILQGLTKVRYIESFVILRILILGQASPCITALLIEAKIMLINGVGASDF